MPRGIQTTGWGFKGIRLFGIALGSARSVTGIEDRLRRQYGKFLYCQGATTMLLDVMVPDANSYHLFSPNGGRDWYAIDEDDAIIGTADEVYPGLLAHLDGMEALTDHAWKNGPIDLASPEGRGLLEGAGFTVVEGNSGS